MIMIYINDNNAVIMTCNNDNNAVIMTCNNDNNAVINNNFFRQQDFILYFKIPMCTRMNFFEMNRQFG